MESSPPSFPPLLQVQSTVVVGGPTSESADATFNLYRRRRRLNGETSPRPGGAILYMRRVPTTLTILRTTAQNAHPYTHTHDRRNNKRAPFYVSHRCAERKNQKQHLRKRRTASQALKRHTREHKALNTYLPRKTPATRGGGPRRHPEIARGEGSSLQIGQKQNPGYTSLRHGGRGWQKVFLPLGGLFGGLGYLAEVVLLKPHVGGAAPLAAVDALHAPFLVGPLRSFRATRYVGRRVSRVQEGDFLEFCFALFFSSSRVFVRRVK